jgi:hypothetical protein
MYFEKITPRYHFSNLDQDNKCLNWEDYAIFSGHAKLPTGIATYELLKIISCAIIVELETGVVKDASFTAISPMTGSFISSLLIGWCIHDGIHIIEERFDKHCHLSSKKAFLKAVELATNKYKLFINTLQSV